MKPQSHSKIPLNLNNECCFAGEAESHSWFFSLFDHPGREFVLNGRPWCDSCRTWSLEAMNQRAFYTHDDQSHLLLWPMTSRHQIEPVVVLSKTPAVREESRMRLEACITREPLIDTNRRSSDNEHSVAHIKHQAARNLYGCIWRSGWIVSLVVGIHTTHGTLPQA